jgi:hypothetical protein
MRERCARKIVSELRAPGWLRGGDRRIKSLRRPKRTCVAPFARETHRSPYLGIVGTAMPVSFAVDYRR